MRQPKAKGFGGWIATETFSTYLKHAKHVSL